MKIKIDKADEIFSQVVRIRDKACKRCGSLVQFNDKGLPISHQNSHYFGRKKETVRFDLENCDTLCHGCHQYWGSDDRESYRAFKIHQLGMNRFNLLTIRANQTTKKDRKMSLIIAKQQLKNIMNQK